MDKDILALIEQRKLPQSFYDFCEFAKANNMVKSNNRPQSEPQSEPQSGPQSEADEGQEPEAEAQRAEPQSEGDEGQEPEADAQRAEAEPQSEADVVNKLLKCRSERSRAKVEVKRLQHLFVNYREYVPFVSPLCVAKANVCLDR